MNQAEINVTEVSLQSLQFVKVLFKMLQTMNELYIGGDDTPYLLRLHGAGEGEQLDVIAEFMIAEDEKNENGFIERGEAAVSTTAIFVERFQNYPALFQEGESWKYLLLDNEPMRFSNFKENNKG